MRPRSYLPRRCAWEECGKEFVPNGPRDKYCPGTDHKRRARTATERNEKGRDEIRGALRQLGDEQRERLADGFYLGAELDMAKRRIAALPTRGAVDAAKPGDPYLVNPRLDPWHGHREKKRTSADDGDQLTRFQRQCRDLMRGLDDAGGLLGPDRPAKKRPGGLREGKPFLPTNERRRVAAAASLAETSPPPRSVVRPTLNGFPSTLRPPGVGIAEDYLLRSSTQVDNAPLAVAA